MFTVNDKIFKAYDIRGLYNQDFDDSFAYQLGLAFVALRKNDSDYQAESPLRIAVGMDMRLSSPALKESLLRGLVAAGAEAIDFGLVSTPTLYFAVGHYGYSGGIMVSASHNPKDWNGFKLVRTQGRPVSGETGLSWIKERILNSTQLEADKPGFVSLGKDVLGEEIAYALSFAPKSDVKPLKIVADTANGMGATYLEPLLSSLPVSLTRLNFKLDGTFPAHEADPLKPENMLELSQAVVSEKADLGIATDGDGDRVFFVDNQGKTIDASIVRGLLAQLFLKDKPGAKIGYDVRPGKITTDLIKAAGGQAVATRVGHSLIKEQMLSNDIYFAGESSGHFFLQGQAGCFEYPSVMIIKLLQHFSSLNEDIASYLKQYCLYYHSGEINKEVSDPEAVLEAINQKYSNARISRLDGITVEYDDFWFNVRVSNTESKVRLNLEATSPALMENKRDEVLSLIK
jgi:phosphomannomutase